MRYLSATQLFNGRDFLPQGSVLVLNDHNGVVEVVDKSQIGENPLEFYEGVITPGFVNAHCHLELSHLKNTIPKHTGLPGFARQIIIERNAMMSVNPEEAQLQADLDMWNKGVVAVGDISNGPSSFTVKQNSSLYYHTFVELIGLNPYNCQTIFDKGLQLLDSLHAKGLSGSLSPHAPYSTSLDLIREIAEYNSFKKNPISIHNQESVEETRFFMGESSGFHDLFNFLQLDISWFHPPHMSSLGFYSEVLDSTPTLFVHNTFSSAEDIALAKGEHRYWCFCPGANLYIENTLPNYTLFDSLIDKICIGTDSLASNDTLDLLHECNLILRHSQVYRPEQLLRFITFNAAQALGIENRFGQFTAGVNAGLNLITIHPQEITFIKKLA